MRVRAAIFSILAALTATATFACEAQLPELGLAGRATETGFSNRTPLGRHESWAPRNANLTLYAAFAHETDEYDHGILGNTNDAKGLTIHVKQPGDRRISCPAEVILPRGEVFEDIAPRLADVTGDGRPEVIVVHTDVRQGARLAVYDRHARLIAATPHIGRTHRWLAPIGAADLNGDGKIEIAYIDRPHLAKRLRIWTFEDNQLTHLADAEGLTNHRIGWNHIPGGIRDCGSGPELVTANADWTRVMSIQLKDKMPIKQQIGAYSGPDSLNRALTCN